MENKKITASDLQFYCGLKCLVYGGGEPVTDTIEGVDICSNKVISERTDYEPHQVKPILKRLEDITLEEVVHIIVDIQGYNDVSQSTKELWHKEALFDINSFGFFQFDKSTSIWTPSVTMYLLKKGYNLHLLPIDSYVETDVNGNLFFNDKLILKNEC
jgi:hypothetical protein